MRMIVGRKRELKYLDKAFASNKAQFITVYGRRRVGKTYLIREYFSQKDCVFLQVTGLQGGSLKQQLEGFRGAAFRVFPRPELFLNPLRSWREAFEIITSEIRKTDKKVIIFLDELPWLASSRSGLLQMIDFYWNNQWAGMRNVILVACGSSASWILEKIVYDKGGLHNRTTRELYIKPFSLAESKEFLSYCCGLDYTDRQVLSLYMAVGGVPYYLEYAEAGLSAAENIQALFFDEGAPLAHEFHKLFESLFEDAQSYIKLIRIIAGKREGVSRAEIGQFNQSGGWLTGRLKELVETGFIHEYLPIGHAKRGKYYRLTDEFCLFYLYWVEGRKPTSAPQNYWVNKQRTPQYRAWSGYTFETICLSHAHQVLAALAIQAAVEISSWRYIPKKKTEKGAQIDLVIDRDDDAITLCEIKYTDKPFVVDKDYAEILKNKIAVFKQKTKTEKHILLALITSSGVRETAYLKNLVSKVVTLKELFSD